MGGSAGSIPVLRELLSGLPADFPAAVLIVVHLPPESSDLLGKTLAGESALPVASARDRMAVESGRVIVASPDFHLVLEDSVVRTTHSARENRHRPSIDVLFRSAAVVYGARVIGVVLSGMLDDGAAGLWSIKRRGGLAIVQDPSDAEYPAMPRHAMAATEVDFCLPAAMIGAKLAELAGESVVEPDEAPPRAMAHEVRMAAESNPDMRELDQLGERTPFTCPECGGALWELSDTGAPRFRCHVGHAYSMGTFAAEQATRVEAAIWAALRVLEENERLARRLADDAGQRGHERSRTYHHESAMTHAKHADILREVLAQSAVSPQAPQARQPKPKKRG